MVRLRRYEPINILNEINELLGNSNNSLSASSERSDVETGHWMPAVDILEKKDAFEIHVDLPGISKSDVNVSMDKNELAIRGERTHQLEQNDDNNYFRTERVHGSFYRRFTLPESADGDNIQATIKQGVLEVIVPKKEISKPKFIEIKGEN